MRVCPKCGLEYDDDCVFCKRCGSKLDGKSDKSYCQYCGRFIDDDSDFCPFCGKPLNKRAVTQSPVSGERLTVASGSSGSAVTQKPKQMTVGTGYVTGTTPLQWAGIVLAFLFDLIVGLVVYHIASMYRRKQVLDAMGLKFTGNEFTSGELWIAIIVGIALYVASWLFVQQYNRKAAKVLSHVLVCLMLSVLGILCGMVVSGILLWIYLAYAFTSYRQSKTRS